MNKCPFIVFMYSYTCKYECTPHIDKYQCGKNNKCSKYTKEGRGIVKTYSKTFMYDKKIGMQIIHMFVRFNRIVSTKVNN